MEDTHSASENGQLAKTIFDEYMKGFAERNPNLRVFSAHLHMDESTPHLHMLHRTLLKHNHSTFYATMLMKGTLLEYLEKVDIKAKNEVDRFIKKLAAKQDITKQLKATDQMKWIGMMNNIKAQTEEIVYSTIIYNREA